MKSLKFKTRIALVFFLAYSLLSFSLIFFFYQKAIVSQKQELRNRLMQVAGLAASSLVPEDIDSIELSPDGVQTAEYNLLVERLRQVKEATPDMDDFYVLVESDKPGLMRFVANADPKEVVECGEYFDITPFPQLAKAFYAPSADYDITQDRWGYWLSGYAPVIRPDGSLSGIVGVDMSADTVALMEGDIKKAALYIFFAGIFASIFAGNLASWWLAKPMQRLIKGMNQICYGNLDYKIPIREGDEFGKLSQNFNDMAGKLKKYIKDLTETTKEKERLRRELEIAAELQKAMLPRSRIKVEGLDLAGISLPAKLVGGDYFDYLLDSGKEKLGFVIADASGKGLRSSIFMTNSKNIFKVMATIESSPAKTLSRTNDQIMDNIDSSVIVFVTMFYGIYEKESRIVQYTNAGHNPPLFINGSTKEVRLLKAQGFPLGVCRSQHYGQGQVKMVPGDILILYTDGVIEATDIKGDMFGLDSLKQVCLDSLGLSSQGIADAIKKSAFEFSGGKEQSDDLTLLVFQVKT